MITSLNDWDNINQKGMENLIELGLKPVN